MIEINKNTVEFINDRISLETSPFFKKIRSEAASIFNRIGCNNRNEDSSNVVLNNFLSKNYYFASKNVPEDLDFNCAINDFNTSVFCLLNGNAITNCANDKKLGYIVDNIINVSDKVENYLGSLIDCEDNGFYALNTAAFTGGFYIEIPDNMVVELPVQLVSVNNCDKDAMFNIRNIIILGKNSQVKLLQCDDISSKQDFFINNVTEIFVGENAHLDFYKLHNLSDNSGVINSIFIKQDSHSVVKTYNVELNAGYLCGNQNVLLSGDFAEIYAYGVYLADKQQEMDNYIEVDHVGTDCISQQVFKGIIDDMACTVFNGKITVHRDSQRTSASQVNRNILLTDKAKVFTKPYLEIYADDVKCSHGSTVGQLDDEALFYMQQRGMSYDVARKLLLNAFVDEVLDKIEINEVKLRINDMVKKRLIGELSQCDNCILRCRDAKLSVDNLLIK